MVLVCCFPSPLGLLIRVILRYNVGVIGNSGKENGTYYCVGIIYRILRV